jgi:hypothetical protein
MVSVLEKRIAPPPALRVNFTPKREKIISSVMLVPSKQPITPQRTKKAGNSYSRFFGHFNQLFNLNSLPNSRAFHYNLSNKSVMCLTLFVNKYKLLYEIKNKYSIHINVSSFITHSSFWAAIWVKQSFLVYPRYFSGRRRSAVKSPTVWPGTLFSTFHCFAVL